MNLVYQKTIREEMCLERNKNKLRRTMIKDLMTFTIDKETGLFLEASNNLTLEL